jgi:hypothetical protein
LLSLFPKERVPALPTPRSLRKGRDHLALRAFPMEYAVTGGFLLAVVAGSFTTVILVGYGIAHLIGFAL